MWCKCHKNRQYNKYFFQKGISKFPLLETLSGYLIFIGIWIVCMLWFLRKNNQSLYKIIGINKKGNTISIFLLGLLIDMSMNGLCVFGAYMHGDILLSFNAFKPLSLALIFISVLIQSSAEELLYRCYLYEKLLNRYNPLVAILASSAFLLFV